MCFLVILLAISPRLAMVGIWLMTDWEDRAFNGSLIPILGIIFLPWTTVCWTIGYVLSGDGAVPWGIMGLIIGVFADVMSYAGSAKPVRNSYQGAR
ncbi:MAG TPA: hypothetical protein VI980_08900 [Acidimicrobiia bacterium]|nr:hypothetical protein [Acidimicrobiia bacterium]